MERWVYKDLQLMLRLQARARILPYPLNSYTGHDQGKMPVVVIPGLLEPWGVMERIADSLSESGHDVYTVPDLGNNQYDITTSAKMVARTVNAFGLNKFAVVGHSKGGIIAKALLNEHWDRISVVFAIATPFSGSNMAYLPKASFLELTPESLALGNLAEKTYLNNKIVSIYPRRDLLVGRKSFILPEAKENIEFDVDGHHTLLIDKRVPAKIKNILDDIE